MIDMDSVRRPNAFRIPFDLAEANAADRQRIATQQRLLSPSDSPADWSMLSSLSRAISSSQTWSANIGIAIRMGTAADDHLSAMQTAIDRALEIAVAAGSPAFGSTARTAAVEELRLLAVELSGLTIGKDASGLPLFSDSPLQLPAGGDVAVPAGVPLTLLAARDNGLPGASVAALADAIASGNSQSIQAAREAVASATEAVTSARSVAGAGTARAERMANRLADARLSDEEDRVRLSSPDIAAIIARIEERQVTIDASNALYARINRTTLFDLLR